MQYKLTDIAKIILGHTLRGAVVESVDGNCSLLQAKDIEENGNLSPSLTMTNIEASRAQGFARKWDVVLSNRGNFRAALYLGEQDNILATSSVYILRVDRAKIIPEYLVVYLNSKTGQDTLHNLNQSTLIKSLTKSDLMNLTIPVPTLEQQQKIIDVQANYLARKKLYIKKSKIHEDIASYAINHLLISQ